jgi:Relaxase/Mobilisation nuclease domain
MIGKITGGGSFGGALEYLTKPKEPKRAEEREQYRERLKEALHTPGEAAPPFEAGERHRVIGGNMSGQTRAELGREFRAISRQRPDIEKPVHHASLSASERDEISVEEWREIAAKYVERMGYKDAPYVVIQHRDGKTDHVHILTSRVDLRGNVVSDWQCKERAEVVLRDIEREHGLEQVKSSHEVDRAAPKRGEIERFNRTGELSAKMSMQSHVEIALKDGPTAAEFIERLQLSGVEAIPYVDKSGRATGISFRKGRELMKGSDLGRGFSWNALQRRGLDYDQERDRPAVEAARERVTAGRDAPAAPAPEHTFADFAGDIGKQVGQHLINQANPFNQIQSQVQTLEQVGRGIADGVSALRDLVTRRDEAEQLSRAATPDAAGRDGLERLQQAAGLDPVKGDRDGLERLSNIPGLEPKDSPSDLTPDKTAPELTPALEPQREEHVIEYVMDFML